MACRPESLALSTAGAAGSEAEREHLRLFGSGKVVSASHVGTHEMRFEVEVDTAAMDANMGGSNGIKVRLSVVWLNGDCDG